MGGISIWQLLIVLILVLLLFGTKRLRNLGGDLGNAIKDLRKGLSDDDDHDKPERLKADNESAKTNKQKDEAHQNDNASK